MLIWGTSTKVIDQSITEGVCSHCGHNELIHYTAQKFFTIFYIPTFPLGKISSFMCFNCGTEYQPEVANVAIEKVSVAKTPWWGYSGSVIIAIFIMLAVIGGKIEGDKQKEYLENPEAGDIVITKIEGEKDTPYAFVKIMTIKDNKVTLKMSKNAFSHESGAEKKARLNSDSVYENEEAEMTMDDLKKMNIVSIKRASDKS